ncbi:LytR/AlgR family response regulator transcription factor [Pedobacter sp. ASV12]|uniref:LytR/AlgR family response regulator transcription factor n=1 Tax=Pedobacter sp. ASV12 TaxID=2795120 RepID=UPI0018ECD17F|nr:LytTR family DNA-binding domain-containing protein [Pedobacter sp. ASV12]
MNTIKCLIVDDEPIARQIIEGYAKQYPLLEVVASCEDAMEARIQLQKQPIDLIFLDINMPVIDGIGFLKTLKKAPQVIFTTAYKEYAVDAFELSASDYLLKPFSFERFLMAVDKVAEKLAPATTPTPVVETIPVDDFMFIKSDNKIFKVAFDDILYLEAFGNYTKVFLSDKQLMPTATLTSLEEVLPKNRFIRVHRSFIINKNHISHIEGNRVFIRNQEVPISANFREGFLRVCGL